MRKIKKKLKKIKHKLTFREWAESDYTFLAGAFIVILMIMLWFL
jgi:hypothetical protein